MPPHSCRRESSAARCASSWRSCRWCCVRSRPWTAPSPGGRARPARAAGPRSGMPPWRRVGVPCPPSACSGRWSSATTARRCCCRCASWPNASHRGPGQRRWCWEAAARWTARCFSALRTQRWSPCRMPTSAMVPARSRRSSHRGSAAGPRRTGRPERRGRAWRRCSAAGAARAATAPRRRRPARPRPPPRSAPGATRCSTCCGCATTRRPCRRPWRSPMPVLALGRAARCTCCASGSIRLPRRRCVWRPSDWRLGPPRWCSARLCLPTASRRTWSVELTGTVRSRSAPLQVRGTS
mmetsp:Transcript_62462/g.193455  ORF Transcript_62462/g.193455 Transcript_62462/m.193455 type:complete len:296 (+) Transcript_62462:707-1594(+)